MGLKIKQLLRANLPLRASYSLLQLIFNKSVYRNKILRTGPEKIVPPGTIFPEKIGPGPKFSVEQNFRDKPLQTRK